jgi:uncharacterized protein YxeA
MGTSFVTSLVPLSTLYILLVVAWVAIGIYIYIAIPEADGSTKSFKTMWQDTKNGLKGIGKWFAGLYAALAGKLTQKANKPKHEKRVIRLAPVEIDGLDQKEHFKSQQKVENGLYLEVTPELESVNHFEKVENGVLPALINPKNSYILVSEQDRDRLVLKDLTLKDFDAYTPGTTVDSGYYVEVNLKHKSTGRYIYTETKLPPSAAKGFRWVRFIRRPLINKASRNIRSSKRIDLGSVVIPGITSRPTYKSQDTVENGLYLEITNKYESVNHFEEVKNGVLPALINESNKYVPVSEEERSLLVLTNINLDDFEGMTPGTKVEAGYYVEIDLKKKSTGRYIYTETKLPPSAAKGYRWVRFMRRQLLDKK